MAYMTGMTNFASLAEAKINQPINHKNYVIEENKDGSAAIVYFQDKPVFLKLPIKIALKVTSAPPGVKGNSAGNVTKIVELETGAQLAVPMFISEGETVLVNTDTGEYTGREQ